MASFLLTWSPTPNTVAQFIQYKEPTDIDWSDYIDVNGSTSTYLVESFPEDTLFLFRIVGICEDESTVYSPERLGMQMTCPELTVSSTGTDISYSFAAPSTEIDAVRVELWKDNIYNKNTTYNTPYSDPTTGTFSSLVFGSTYKIKVVLTKDTSDVSSEDTRTEIRQSCPLSDVITPVCINVKTVTLV